jgi:hypothetical protein
MSTSAVTIVNRAKSVQSGAVAPFVGLKSMAVFPISKKVNNDITSITSNGGRVHCMQVRKTLYQLLGSVWIDLFESMLWKQLMIYP